MDPYTEQRLRNEVIYLHSLWHQGPIPPHPPPINLHPSNPPRFKKPHKKTPKPHPPKKTGNFSGKEWPVKPPPADPPLTPSGWPQLKLKPKTQPTEQELENIKWINIQQRAIDVTKQFYLNNSDENSDEDDDDNDDDELDSDDDDDDNNINNDDMVEGFVMKLFDEVEGLREYYLKYCGGGGGEFLCLICGGAGEKSGKRFKDCVALVQHSVAIAKTKKRRSHRALGKVVCKVLGWEIDRLPVSGVLEQKCSVNLIGRPSDVAENGDGESMVCESSTDRNFNSEEHDGMRRRLKLDTSAVANVEEYNKNQVLNEAEGCTGGAVNNLCRNLSSTMVLEQVPCDLQTN